jgi:hypothetical protein
MKMPVPALWDFEMTRSLAIEELGTSFEVEKRVPLVRLKGRWLKAAGFLAGRRVSVRCLSPGVMELRLEASSETSQPRSEPFAFQVPPRPALSDWENQTVLHFSYPK